ncbi:MAG: zinc-ribbon domain-containing protein [Anaeroplasmataceae bacterium]|nr:zinc-ribbon domain-containing protein [Anaeroplasmataceae bacterium]
MKYCSHCGAEINDEAVVCVKCGCSVAPTKKLENPNESTTPYVVLGFLFQLSD